MNLIILFFLIYYIIKQEFIFEIYITNNLCI